MTILIVDDHELHRKTVGARLKRNGFAVTEAVDGIEAMGILNNAHIDFVISDVLMPRMDGYELCQEIRKSKTLSTIPVVLFSAIYTAKDDEKAALDSGADMFFVKPVPEADLLDAIQKLGSAKKRPKKSAVRKEQPELREYSARLVQKLEETAEQLEERHAQLEKSERRFRTLAKTVATGILIYSGGEILYANLAAEELTGYSSDELSQMNPLKLIYEEDRETASRRLFMGEGMITSSSRLHLRIITKTGAVRWTDFSSSLIDYDGRNAAVGTMLDITEQKRAELDLRESEGRYRQLVENSLGLICIHDLEGFLLVVNPAAAEKLGYTIEEMVGKNLRDFLSPSVRHTFSVYLKRIAEHGADNGLMRIQTSQGKELIWHYHNVLNPSPGKPLRVLGHALDVTEQQEMQEQLRESQEQLQAIVDNEPECVKVLDNEGRILQMNPAGLAMIEADDSSQVIGKSSYSIIAPEYHDAFKELVNDVFRGKKKRLEFEIVGLKGGRRWLETHATPLRNKKEHITAMLSVTRDTTERRLAQERLQQQAALLDVDPAGIYVLDREGRVSFWNRSAERMYGLKRDEILGKLLLEHLQEQFSSQFKEAWEVIFLKKKWLGTRTQHKPDKGEIIVETEWTLIQGKEGKPESVYIVDSDVTERKNLESQFLRAQRMENLGMVAGGIAHDLNNILSPIMLSTQIARKHAAEQGIIRLLDVIETSAKRGSDIVKQILGFARGKEGTRSILRLDKLIGEVANFLKETFPKTIHIKQSVSGDLWPVLANSTHLHQVILNLCINARDAMLKGGTLTLGAENQLLDSHYAYLSPGLVPGPYVIVTVIDTGVGIPKEIKDRIFEPFFTTKSPEEGTGLGLSTVTGIVQNHGGFVNVYSEPGKGTTFRVFLPAVRTQATERAEKEITLLPNGNGETILVVEDEATLREMTKEILESYGYKALVANDGTEAIGLFAQNRDAISLVLCDISMPFMDGPSTIKAMIKTDPSVKVVVVSGFGEGAKLVENMRPNVREFIAKPYPAEKLLKTIDKVLRSK
ncbi:MAG: PAS domain S-box protein [Bacteroidota bacterium]